MPEWMISPSAAGSVALLAREEDTWVPKLKKDSEFWRCDPVVGE